MPSVQSNGNTIHYDEFGLARDPVILLTIGLGLQAISWPRAFCEPLAAQGFRVIRYDNRDTGHSTKFGDAGVPDVQALLAGKDVPVPYKLPDMAADAVGLLDALGIQKAHVAGMSMGGMISQEIAARYPDRVLSLVSIMSTTGDPSVPPGKPEAMQAIFTPPPSPARADVVAAGIVMRKVIGSPGYPMSDAELADIVGSEYDRCYYPEGMMRQAGAIFASGSRVDLLAKVTAPTLVIHGAADPLVPVEGGQSTAKSVPGARLEIVEGFGHDLPNAFLPKLADMIGGFCKAA